MSTSTFRERVEELHSKIRQLEQTLTEIGVAETWIQVNKDRLGVAWVTDSGMNFYHMPERVRLMRGFSASDLSLPLAGCSIEVIVGAIKHLPLLMEEIKRRTEIVLPLVSEALGILDKELS